MRRSVSVDGRTPLLSACMIVKDEQENLPSCLSALTGLVDEIVVYDTGSTDDTVAIAEAAGATVVQGYWDDDFARARNSALEHCRGEWILQVDADEVVQGDVATVRTLLSGTSADALQVKIDNIGDDGKVSIEHVAVRLFRRTRAHWQGGLHEQVVPRGPLPLEFAECADVRLWHGGYTSAAMAAGDKVARNARVARAAAAATDGGADLHVKISLARALMSAGQHDEAMTHLEDVRTGTKQSDLLRHALRAGAETLLALGRPQEALSWARELRRYSSSTMPDYLEGLALAQTGQADKALEKLSRVHEASDEELSLAQHAPGLHRARILADAGLWEQAADELWQLASDGILPTASWPALVETHWRSDLGVERLADVLGDHVVPVLGKLLSAPVEAVDLFLECLWARWGVDARLLAAAAQIGPRLGLERAMDWSLRLRANGLVQDCTLASLANSAAAPALDRLRACAVLHEATDDPRGEVALRQVAAGIPVDDLREALLALDELSPQLLGRFVDHAASDATRAKALAEILTALGATEQAEALLAHRTP
jgi:tetratricopeptide (TPR) repeat protein